MQTYLNILEELKEVTEQPKRSWKWIRFWDKPKTQKQSASDDPEQEALVGQAQDTELPKGVPDLILKTDEERRWQSMEIEHPTAHAVYRKLLNVIRVLGRDDGKLIFLVNSYRSKRLPSFSSLRRESWNWSLSICSIRVHSSHKALLSALARRMGSRVIHACLRYDYWCFKYHWLGQIHRYCDGCYYRHYRMGHVQWQPLCLSILRMARQLALLLCHHC